MNKKVSMWLSLTLKQIVIVLLLTIALGYIFGFRAALVIGASSEPKIHIGSLVIDYKCPYQDLQVGDYITFKTGSTLTTHMIVAIAGRGDFEGYANTFEKNDKIQFVNRGVKFERTISQKCQIVTMATNFSNYEEYVEKTNNDPTFVATDGSGVECVNYENVVGKVIYSFTNTGKFIFFVRNNFLQIVVYGIIFCVGALLLKKDSDYTKLF